MEINLKKEIKLPSPPAIAIRILEAVKDCHSTSCSLAQIVSADPALSAQVLRLANSSLYPTNVKVDSVERAVTVLGVETLKNIALSFVIAKANTGDGNNGFDFNRFWKRALTAAVGANFFADLLRVKKSNTFVTALLMDIGMLFMYVSHPEAYMSVFTEKLAGNGTLVESERAIFGTDHQEIGARILEHWQLPHQIFEPIRYHHCSRAAPKGFDRDATILWLADKTSSVYHGGNSVEKITAIQKILKVYNGLAASAVTDIIDQIGEQCLEVMSLYDIDPGGMKPYSQLLLEANEELGKLNLSYEQLILDLKQQKRKSDRLANELRATNEQLRELALKDGLTGLYNHTYFQDSLKKEMSQAGRYGRALSLLLFDLDHFKKINDTYGHPTGDRVLEQVGAVIRETTREADIAARYGGEEFAVILPETDLKGARVIAERLRSAVEGLCIANDLNATLCITISCGIAAASPLCRDTKKSVFIHAADQALYRSKRNGRNRVSEFSLS
ncbi:MAG: diguanylate cyclase [Desulfobacteraceae bacterium]|jgi:diguanylate cyclase (GGDEF)-like protein